MSLTTSLQRTNKVLAQRILQQTKALSPLQERSMTILSKESGDEYKKMNYSARMQKTGRPVSPHMTIYSFPIAALSSITNRVTGTMMSFGAAGLGAIELVGGSGTALSMMQSIGDSSVAVPAKLLVSFPLVYHYLGAVRHTAWDRMPQMLESTDVEKTSYILVGSSVVLSLGLSVLA